MYVCVCVSLSLCPLYLLTRSDRLAILSHMHSPYAFPLHIRACLHVYTPRVGTHGSLALKPLQCTLACQKIRLLLHCILCEMFCHFHCNT